MGDSVLDIKDELELDIERKEKFRKIGITVALVVALLLSIAIIVVRRSYVAYNYQGQSIVCVNLDDQQFHFYDVTGDDVALEFEEHFLRSDAPFILFVKGVPYYCTVGSYGSDGYRYFYFDDEAPLIPEGYDHSYNQIKLESDGSLLVEINYRLNEEEYEKEENLVNSWMTYEIVLQRAK